MLAFAVSSVPVGKARATNEVCAARSDPDLSIQEERALADSFFAHVRPSSTPRVRAVRMAVARKRDGSSSPPTLEPVAWQFAKRTSSKKASLSSQRAAGRLALRLRRAAPERRLDRRSPNSLGSPERAPWGGEEARCFGRGG